MSESALDDFLAATGTDDVTVARRYLEMANNDINEAVSVFFEVEPSVVEAATDVPSPRSGVSSVTGRQRGSCRSNSRGAATVSDDFVREAVPSFQETLVQTHDVRLNSRNSSYAGLGSAATARVIDVTDSDNEGDNALDSLFAPPAKLVHAGSFDEAKTAATKTGRLLLVNIQDATDFQSMKLNRDVWRNQTIQSVVESHFVFWQRNRNSPDSDLFSSLYKVSRVPHIAAVEPRTGRQLHVWSTERFNGPEDAVCELISFIESRQSTQNTNRCPSATQRSMPSDVNTSPQTVSSSSSPTSVADDDGGLSQLYSTTVSNKSISNNTAKRSKIDKSAGFTSTARSIQDDLSKRQTVTSSEAGSRDTTLAISNEYNGINNELAQLRRARESRNNN